ncbi:uncharacterized protein [Watersipora subatra]|uniref:uncharacterized protein n=1 Tax=Watersipora subatra TaxID=2589382 RepID=UPI00355B8AC6
MAAASPLAVSSDSEEGVVVEAAPPSKKPKKLAGSKASANLLAELNESCPNTFKKHSEYELCCLECRSVINIRRGGAKDARKHTNTTKHIKAVERNKKQNSLDMYGLKNKEDNNVIESEVMLIQMLTMKNVSFVACAEVARGLKSVCSDSKIAKSMMCGATKVAQITKCIGNDYNTQVIAELKLKPFTLMIDESNDSGEKVLAILASLYDEPTKTNSTRFVQLVKCSDASANGIFKLVDSFFKTHGVIKWTNVVAFQSDNCNVMKGKHKGVIRLIRDQNPNVVDMGCICHLCNLCVKKASQALPFSVDDLLVDIHYHFDNSMPRTEELKSYFAAYPDLEYKRMLKHCSTRWLSIRPCLERLLVFYEPIMKYFIDCKEAEKRGKAKNIKEILTDPVTKPLLFFLSDTLKTVDKYNVLFQNEQFILDRGYEATLSLIKDLLGRILPPEKIRPYLRHDLSQIDLSSFLEPSEFAISTDCRIELERIYDEDTETEHKVLNYCKDWILAFFTKLRTTFPVDLLKAFSVLNPQTISENRNVIKLFIDLCKLIGAPVPEDLKTQLRMMLCDEFDTAKDCIPFWIHMAEKYPAVQLAMSYILAFPNSNAGTERLFSLLKAVHTPVRNSLAIETINAILQMKVNKRSPATEIDNKDELLKRCKKATMDYNRLHSS